MRRVADVPKGTLASIVQRLNAEAIRIGASTPEAVAALIKSDSDRPPIGQRDRARHFQPGGAVR